MSNNFDYCKKKSYKPILKVFTSDARFVYKKLVGDSREKNPVKKTNEKRIWKAIWTYNSERYFFCVIYFLHYQSPHYWTRQWDVNQLSWWLVVIGLLNSSGFLLHKQVFWWLYSNAFVCHNFLIGENHGCNKIYREWKCARETTTRQKTLKQTL